MEFDNANWISIGRFFVLLFVERARIVSQMKASNQVEEIDFSRGSRDFKDLADDIYA